MALKAGIIGLPNVGKSTLFNAITNSQVEAANYPFATINPNVGIIALVDERLNQLVALAKPQKISPATFEFIDIAGLVAGAAKGEGLGNKFLANIREVDALVHVVRCFEDEAIINVNQSLDSVRDAKTVSLELLLADYDVVAGILTRLERRENALKGQVNASELSAARKISELLVKELPARQAVLSEEELSYVKNWHLLTAKSQLYVANLAENDLLKPLANRHYAALAELAQSEGAHIIAISAQIESELASLPEDERAAFSDSLGIKDSGLVRLANEAFKLLGLATFFTVGPKEVRAWVFKRGMTAPNCAGIIHSDFERGFIRAQVISYQDYMLFQGEHGAQLAGKVRNEGKDYLMQDGDVVLFKFNV